MLLVIDFKENKMKQSINQTEITKIVAQKTNIQDEVVDEIIRATIQEIVNNINNDINVKIPCFGTFSMRKIKGRMGYNPIAKNAIYIPEHRRPHCKFSRHFKTYNESIKSKNKKK